MAGKIPIKIFQKIRTMLEGINFGSLEIYIVNGRVTQLTQRMIHKTEPEPIRKRSH